MNGAARTVQLGIVHPDQVPPAAASFLPALPEQISNATVDALMQMRLPR